MTKQQMSQEQEQEILSGINTQAAEIAEALNEYEGDNWFEEVPIVQRYYDHEKSERFQGGDSVVCTDGSYCFYSESRKTWMFASEPPMEHESEESE